MRKIAGYLNYVAALVIGFGIILAILAVVADASNTTSGWYIMNYLHQPEWLTVVGSTGFGLLWLMAIIAIFVVSAIMAKTLVGKFRKEFPGIRLGFLDFEVLPRYR